MYMHGEVAVERSPPVWSIRFRLFVFYVTL